MSQTFLSSTVEREPPKYIITEDDMKSLLKYTTSSETSLGAEGSLLGYKGISPQEKEWMYEYASKRDLKEKYVDSLYRSLNRCGEDTGLFMTRQCGCGSGVLKAQHHCDNRTCPNCSPKRTAKLFNQYQPMLNTQNHNPRGVGYRFLTISPENYEECFPGHEDIRKNYTNFLRNKYVKPKIQGSLYVIEAKYNPKTKWNIHIHAIIYGTRLDNQVKAHCITCKRKQALKSHYNKETNTKTFSCKTCNTPVLKQGNSKLVNIWMKISGRSVNIDVKQMSSKKHSLKYMLKYIGHNKNEFHNRKHFIEYLIAIYKKKLIQKTGIFAKQKIDTKIPHICHKCGEIVHFDLDFTLQSLFEEHLDPIRPTPPLNLLNYTGGEVV